MLPQDALRDDSETLRWLFSLADQERGIGWNPRASPDEQWKLGRTRALLDIAGAPDRRMRVALVAGTKGKGSTCAMLASILGAAGVRCGLYTKPHLQSYRERIRVDGQAVDPPAFEAALWRMRGHVATLLQQHPQAGEPTTFEVTTAMAVNEFARQGCELAVVEVGLGGRLDATNALEPYTSVITSISYDHTAILGRSLGSIAREKAGILRSGRPAFLARQRPAARAALRRACVALGARCLEVPPFAPARELSLAGAHQQQNAALAAAGARAMSARVDDRAVDRGLSRLRWAGRFEVLDGPPPVVLDGAHNGASAEALSAALLAYAAGRPLFFVIGINRDKDARAVLRPLLAIARAAWATQAADNPRALPAADLGRLAAVVSVHADPDLTQTLDSARARAAREGGIVCVTGSLALVGQARSALGLPVQERLW